MTEPTTWLWIVVCNRTGWSFVVAAYDEFDALKAAGYRSSANKWINRIGRADRHVVDGAIVMASVAKSGTHVQQVLSK